MFNHKRRKRKSRKVIKQKRLHASVILQEKAAALERKKKEGKNPAKWIYSKGNVVSPTATGAFGQAEKDILILMKEAIDFKYPKNKIDTKTYVQYLYCSG